MKKDGNDKNQKSYNNFHMLLFLSRCIELFHYSWTYLRLPYPKLTDYMIYHE